MVSNEGKSGSKNLIKAATHNLTYCLRVFKRNLILVVIVLDIREVTILLLIISYFMYLPPKLKGVTLT